MASTSTAPPAMLHSSVCSSFIPPLAKPSASLSPPLQSPQGFLTVTASSSTSSSPNAASFMCSRRSMASLSSMAGMIYLLSAAPDAMADIEDDYKQETQKVIVQVRATLGLDKTDPSRGDAVRALRQVCNSWVAKYRREKKFAGKPSYSNIYSVVNAVSGHYISYGDGAPLPAKRKTQVLEEVDTAERALGRGR